MLWTNLIYKMDYKNKEWSKWTAIIRQYTQPSHIKSWWQIINTLVPYLVLWVLMIYSLNYSYWITLGLSVLSAGFLVRIFIIFHDCGHKSFFKSDKLNKIVGIITGAMVFTPYHRWHYTHKVHHSTVGNLDKRGMGDVMTWTVKEYNESSKKKKLFYRIYRNPIIMLIIAPFFLFAVSYRLPNKNLPKPINRYTQLTNLGLALAITAISLLIGFKSFILIQIPVLFFASTAGVWLFYIQHQFEDVLWQRDKIRDYRAIAMKGSSYVKFPKILQWFSGNIGFHHIHHLSLKIPNYNLEKCMRENAIFQKDHLTFASSLQCIRYKLWDEEQNKIISIKEAMQGA